MGRGAWWATVCGVTRVGHDLVTKPPPPPKSHCETERIPSSVVHSCLSSIRCHGRNLDFLPSHWLSALPPSTYHLLYPQLVYI